MSKYKWDLSEENNTEINKIINNVWDANKNAIEGGDNLQYRLDTRGLTIKSPTDPLKYLRAVNSVIAITNDGGNTWKNALTWQGLIAERLYGMIIAGANLTIENTSGTFRVDGEGVTVTGMNMSLITTNVKNKININPTDGIRVQKNIGTTSSPIWQDQISLDAAGDASFSGNVTIGTGNDVFKATSQGIQLGHASFGAAPFRVDMRGNAVLNQLTANQATIHNSNFNGGAITGSSINVNGRFLVDSNGNMSATNGRFSGDITGSNISGGTITGSTIQTSYNGPRIVLDVDGLRAIDTNGRKRIAINTDSNTWISRLSFYDASGNESGYLLTLADGIEVYGSRGLKLHAGSGDITMNSMVYFTRGASGLNLNISDVNGLYSELRNLQYQIDTLRSEKANKNAYTSTAGPFNGGIPIGTVLVTASGGRVTWSGIREHDHRQN